MIAIVDYGLGNLRSVAGAVRKLGFEPVITADAGALRTADKLILPGVGAFGDGMRNLTERGLIDLLDAVVRRDGKPILGICLGAQLMARSSDEFGMHEGLGWIAADVRRIYPDDEALRVPHVGWNQIAWTGDCLLRSDLDSEQLFYFVHSYCITADDEAAVKATCTYGQTFVAVFQTGNIYGTQFHPEKSQQDGLTVLGNFLKAA